MALTNTERSKKLRDIKKKKPEEYLLNLQKDAARKKAQRTNKQKKMTPKEKLLQKESERLIHMYAHHTNIKVTVTEILNVDNIQLINNLILKCASLT